MMGIHQAEEVLIVIQLIIIKSHIIWKDKSDCSPVNQIFHAEAFYYNLKLSIWSQKQEKKQLHQKTNSFFSSLTGIVGKRKSYQDKNNAIFL